MCVVSGFCHSVNEICTLTGFYAAENGFLPTFCDNPSIPYSWVLENGTARLSQNFDNLLSM